MTQIWDIKVQEGYLSNQIPLSALRSTTHHGASQGWGSGQNLKIS